ncbi:MAG: glutamate-ammonia-ligase adenylyltransferase [Spirochaetota bacterium]
MSTKHARPALEELVLHAPRLEELARRGDSGLAPDEALRRLPDRYFALYDSPTVAHHLELLCALSLEEPYAIDARRLQPGRAGERRQRLELTVVTVDDPGMLSLLAGMLGAAGFDILSGDVFTLEREHGPVQRSLRRRPVAAVRTTLPKRRIVDRFIGTLGPDVHADEFFGSLTDQLDRIIPRILPGGDRDEARRLVNEAVADRLRGDEASAAAALYPLEIGFDTAPEGLTRMIITGEDTPFFLYALSTALSLQNISIESVSIETRRHVIRDVFELVDGSGAPISDQSALDRIRFSVLLTKQFTYFLDRAPDPYAALVRFETMSRDLVTQTDESGIESILSRPLVLRELAQLLGASDFLWEDFIRLQYENIIPMLTRPQELSSPSEELEARLRKRLERGTSHAERVQILNEFKDREGFLVDLDHILHPGRDFFFLSNRLSDLAELVVQTAMSLAWEEMIERYGRPRTVAGLETSWAVFGLGKLGGRAIGYASDIELLFVYRDAGTTDGPDPVPNAEFFERLFVEATGCIHSKREGIFRVDLRLRPHGKAGPHAVSLESFNRYYGRDGEAHSYERLALTRLRAIAGSRSFGRQVEELRDDLIYAADSVDLAQIRSLRERQFREKSRPGTLNAKFSPGALVDLEYGLQILLVQHGRANPRLRTPSLHAGLEELERSGLLDPDEASRLVRSYRFLRNLINGLRMLRGNAQDLFLPAVDSLEYAHLARRAGYTQQGDLSAAEQLHIDFEARTAAVRAFLERHLGRESIPGERPGNAADLVLASDLSEEVAGRILDDAGITNHSRAKQNLRGLAREGATRDVFSELVILVWQALRSNIDPDMALNNWERFVARLTDPTEHYHRLLRQPRMLDLMLQVFASSSFLAETLIGEPDFLEWALDARTVSRPRGEDEMLTDLLQDGVADLATSKRRALIRNRRKRELLRIGTRDICLKADLGEITGELSALARAMVRADLEAIWNELDASPQARTRLVILAFGKLGGNELNYSSDIDILGMYEQREESQRESDTKLFSEALTRLRADLSDHTTDGYAYRVDFRLRPYGSAGPLVPPISTAIAYYAERASAWEHQALIKLTPIAGNTELGAAFLDAVKPSSIRHFSSPSVRESIQRLRAQAVKQTRDDDDIKSGEGGIRDIEFLVQGLQMIHAADHPQVLTSNTVAAIEELRNADVIAPGVAEDLITDYRRLRRIEHFLQIYEDRQVHALPRGDHERGALARRLDGRSATASAFLEQLAERRTRVRTYYERFLDDGEVGEPITLRSAE